MTEEDGSREAQPQPRESAVAGEDFLFHLYRGSELLQDNRVHEAKQELEQALNFQPRDAKGQDLLAIVYFRLGLYPRAISIYEGLIGMYPSAATPRINLALCYLKTGQAQSARTELEKVLELSPHHARAWGYLGLAFQRLGDYARAYNAFASGGHDAMARRLAEMTGLVESRDAEPPQQPYSVGRSAVGHAMGAALDEIDRSDFRTDAEVLGQPSASGTWSAVEPGREAPRESRVPPMADRLSPSLIPSLAPSESLLPPLSIRGLDGREVPIPLPPEVARFDQEGAPIVPPPSDVPRSAAPRPRMEPPEPADQFARKLLLVYPRLHQAALHPSGLVLMKSVKSVAVRFDLVRTFSFGGGMSARPLMRKSRGRDMDEPLGGVSTPLVEIEGSGELVLGAPSGFRLVVLAAGSEALYVRESAIAALDGSLIVEHGKLGSGDGEAVPMVQLRAPTEENDGRPSQGVVVLILPLPTSSVEVTAPRSLMLRTQSLIGWTGRLIPRNLPPSETPGKARGFVALSGEGTVLIDGR